MAFRFDEDQLALADGVEDLFLGRAKGDYARAVVAGEADWRTLWDAVSELGIPAMAVPEDLGGLGLGPIELVAVCERVGRHLAAAPIVATAGGFVPTASAAGATAALERVAAGAAATLAYVEPTDPATLELRDGNLHASAVPVPDATRVDLIGFVVADPEGEARSLVVLPTDAVELTRVEGLDGTRPLALAAVEGAAVEAMPLPHRTAGLAVAFTTASAELLGIGARMLELAVEHARERRQFGVPIGSFQAVKHRLADALVELERARSLTYRAAVVCSGGDSAAALRAGRMAKAAASDAATEIGRSAVQVFGGLGITYEADISLFYLRARQASMQLGGRDAHYAALVARGSTG